MRAADLTPPAFTPAAVTPSAFTPPLAESPPTPSAAEFDIFAAIEKLADLHGKGVLSDEEFTSKKAELLARL